MYIITALIRAKSNSSHRMRAKTPDFQIMCLFAIPKEHAIIPGRPKKRPQNLKFSKFSKDCF